MRLIFFYLFLFKTLLIYGQQKILLSTEKKPIEFANIYSGYNGIVSNEKGFFDISGFVNNDTLTISHVGYAKTIISINQLKKIDTIFLTPNRINLDEIILSGFNAKDTLIKAISNIKKNYLVNSYNSLGLYRQTLKEDGKGVELVEASFINYHPEFKSNEKSRGRILGGKATKNISKFDFETIGGVMILIDKGDVVKNGRDLFDIKFLNNYKVSYLGSIDNKENGTNLYVLKYDPAEKSNLRVNKSGKIFIDKLTLAIIEIQMTRDKAKLLTLKKNSPPPPSLNRPIYNLSGSQSIIKYRKATNQKYVLSFVSGINFLDGTFKNEEHKYEYTVKFMITDIRSINVEKIKSNYNGKKHFAKQVSSLDSEQWLSNSKFIPTREEKKLLKEILEGYDD